MKDLKNTLFLKNLFFSLFLVTHFSCNRENQPKYEDYNEEDFLLVPGIVTKVTRTPIFARGWWYDYNIFYAYSLDSDTISVGKEMDVDMAVSEGEAIYILVHKYKKGLSFPTGRRITPNDEKVIQRYLKKSQDHGVKYFGIDEK
ncbi:hypothetical protein [Allomuricauda sp. M10]|uniref:hypothetical protein n=1 Tax=Allomuricauda sp. M10 TaxID=2683292 RepID=UPI001D17D671|nr:hypothetical protein [Muricauda sp. M10]